VALKGSVGNSYEKIKARKIAGRIVGVQDIYNQLEVDETKNRGVRKALPALSNDRVRGNVREELAQDTRIDNSSISVQGAYGHITLNGSVSSLYVKHLAEQDVRDVVGVGWVTNNLVVQGNQHEDWVVAEDVEYALKTDFALQNEDFFRPDQKGHCRPIRKDSHLVGATACQTGRLKNRWSEAGEEQNHACRYHSLF